MCPLKSSLCFLKFKTKFLRQYASDKDVNPKVTYILCVYKFYIYIYTLCIYMLYIDFIYIYLCVYILYIYMCVCIVCIDILIYYIYIYVSITYMYMYILIYFSLCFYSIYINKLFSTYHFQALNTRIFFFLFWLFYLESGFLSIAYFTVANLARLRC